jgi:hypothetical protein
LRKNRFVAQDEKPRMSVQHLSVARVRERCISGDLLET